jgi:predicted PurR-regulated permease PerM
LVKLAALISNPVGMVTAVFSGTGTVAAHLLETLLVLFYFLVFGETFLRRLVEVLPTFANKREALCLARDRRVAERRAAAPRPSE